MKHALILLALLLPVTASAHTAESGFEYPNYCCHNRDCAEIPASAVRYDGGAYLVTVIGGTHPMVSKTTTYRVAEDKKQVAPDGKWHICIIDMADYDSETSEGFVRCFFGPGVGA